MWNLRTATTGTSSSPLISKGLDTREEFYKDQRRQICLPDGSRHHGNEEAQGKTASPIDQKNLTRITPALLWYPWKWIMETGPRQRNGLSSLKTRRTIIPRRSSLSAAQLLLPWRTSATCSPKRLCAYQAMRDPARQILQFRFRRLSRTNFPRRSLSQVPQRALPAIETRSALRRDM